VHTGRIRLLLEMFPEASSPKPSTQNPEPPSVDFPRGNFSYPIRRETVLWFHRLSEREPSAALFRKRTICCSLLKENHLLLSFEREPSAALFWKREPSAALFWKREPSAALFWKRTICCSLLEENHLLLSTRKTLKRPGIWPNTQKTRDLTKHSKDQGFDYL